MCVCVCGAGGGELVCIRVVGVWVCECMWWLLCGDRGGRGPGHHIFNTETKFSLEDAFSLVSEDISHR